MTITLTGKRLQITIETERRVMRLCRWCHHTKKFLRFGVRWLDNLSWSVDQATNWAKQHICTVEGLTDAEIKETKTA